MTNLPVWYWLIGMALVFALGWIVGFVCGCWRNRKGDNYGR